MKLKRKHLKLFTTGLLAILAAACNNQAQKMSDESVKSGVSNSVKNGNNELENPDTRKSSSISNYNTDNSGIKNIDRPDKSTIATELDTTLLFGIWTSDPNGPHADFELTSKSFNVVDYDGDGEMPYELKDNQLKIYYNDFIQEGKIISVDKDTLKIKWKDFDNINNYVRWTQ